MIRTNLGIFWYFISLHLPLEGAAPSLAQLSWCRRSWTVFHHHRAPVGDDAGGADPGTLTIMTVAQEQLGGGRLRARSLSDLPIPWARGRNKSGTLVSPRPNLPARPVLEDNSPCAFGL